MTRHQRKAPRLFCRARPAGLRRFDKSGEYAADGAVGIVGWLRWKCKLTAGAAMERVTIARQVDQLPKTEQARRAVEP